MPTCAFEFDRSEQIYYAGETIKGTGILDTLREDTIKEIYLEFIGQAKVCFDELSALSNKNAEQDQKTCHGQETYVSNRASFFQDGILYPGNYRFAFDIQLPKELPSSCIEKYGCVIYEISLIISRPNGLNDVYRQPLTILNKLNLNRSPLYAISLHGEDTQYSCCWPLKCCSLSIRLILPFAGYAPGQTIKYTVEVNNKSNRAYDLNAINVRLVQFYDFTATIPYTSTRPHNIIIAEGNPSQALTDFYKHSFKGSLPIPPVPPTRLMPPRGIIVVTYYVELEVKAENCRHDMKLKVPITIGTVPLVQSASNCPNDISNFDSNSIAPPIYEQTTTVKQPFLDFCTDGHSRVSCFLPSYPMFKNFKLPIDPSTETPNVDYEATAPFLNAA